MDSLLLEDAFEDIFSDPALLECEDSPDLQLHSSCPQEEAVAHSEPLINKASTSQDSKGSCRAVKSLNKKERSKIVSKLRAISGVEVVKVVVEKLSREPHMEYYPEREQLLASLLDSSYEELVTICAKLSDMFVCTYITCDTGREKYGRFQVEWHKCCSKFLLSVSEKHDCLDGLPADQMWLALTRSYPTEVRNPLMIAVTAAIYGHMLQKVRSIVKENSGGETSKSALQHEPDEVYLRFGGGALADMFKQRYKDMRSKKKSSKTKDIISQEIQVLGWIRRVDKSTLPASLAYRDQGGMYFPDDDFLPFIRNLDECVRESANEDAFQRYGKNLVKVVSEQVQHNQHLFEEFKTVIHNKVEGSEYADKSIAAVYTEFSRKISNTRINEFLDTSRQKSASDKGKATLSGQNLRDTLLSQHVNLKSKSNN